MDYVLKREKITIIGRTNINKFQCHLELDEFLDSLQITVKRENGSFNFSGLKLNIPVDGFNCKYRLMTAEFRSLLQSDQYPYLNLNIGHAEQTVADTVQMQAKLAVADKRREELIKNCRIDKRGKELVLAGTHSILLTSYDIEPPRKFFGAVVVRDELEISFEVVLTQQTKKEPH